MVSTPFAMPGITVLNDRVEPFPTDLGMILSEGDKSVLVTCWHPGLLTSHYCSIEDTTTNTLYVTTASSVLVVDRSTFAIRLLAGNTSESGKSLGTSWVARFDYLYGIAMRRDRVLLVADSKNNRICAVSLLKENEGMVSAIPHGELLLAMGAIIDRDGTSLWVTDAHRLVHIAVCGHTTIVAGEEKVGYAGHADGLGSEARFFCPQQCTMDPITGIIYVADSSSARQVDMQPHAIRAANALCTIPALAAFPPGLLALVVSALCALWEMFVPFAEIHRMHR